MAPGSFLDTSVAVAYSSVQMVLDISTVSVFLNSCAPQWMITKNKISVINIIKKMLKSIEECRSHPLFVLALSAACIKRMHDGYRQLEAGFYRIWPSIFFLLTASKTPIGASLKPNCFRISEFLYPAVDFKKKILQ